LPLPLVCPRKQSRLGSGGEILQEVPLADYSS